MSRQSYFAEVRRRALEIDWRARIALVDPVPLEAVEVGDILARARYRRIDDDLLLVVPGDEGLLLHRFFELRPAPDVTHPTGRRLNGSWLDTLAGATIAIDPETRLVDPPGGETVALETERTGRSIAFRGAHHVTLGPDTRAWLRAASGADPDGWNLRLLTGSVVCAPIDGVARTITVETPRGWGRWQTSRIGIQIGVANEPDLIALIAAGEGDEPWWHTGGVMHRLTPGREMVGWNGSAGARLFHGAIEENATMLSQPLEEAFGLRSRATSADGGRQAPAAVGRRRPAEAPARMVIKGRPAIPPPPPLTVTGAHSRMVPHYDGPIDLTLTVDRGSLSCRPAADLKIQGDGTRSLQLRGPLPSVNAVLPSVAWTAGGADQQPGVVILRAVIGDGVFETRLPIDQVTGAPPRRP
jgi:hypothetical protein